MNDTTHIVSSFDRDLESVQAHIMKMGGLVEQSILDAAKALRERDEELSEKVRTSDKAIDALEEVINEEASRIIALRAPTAVDLRVILSVMKIAGNLERIGDYAKNMAKRIIILAYTIHDYCNFYLFKYCDKQSCNCRYSTDDS